MRQLPPSSNSSAPYPDGRRARDAWIRSRRPDRSPLDPWRPHAWLTEDERNSSGEVVSSVAVFLTNRECPWTCLMCDLWKTTLTDSVPQGAIPAQIDYAFERLGLQPGSAADFVPAPPSLHTVPAREHRLKCFPREVKIYNSGSFYDSHAIPPADIPAIAARVARFERVIVECHPALVGEACLRFRDLLIQAAANDERGAAATPSLEVAMGLETAHPEVLRKLNKGIDLKQFRQAAHFLYRNAIGLRVFVLVKPPFLDEASALDWAKRSIDFAFDAGAAVVSLIPVRGGNGALEALRAQGQFAPPRLATVEGAQDYGISAAKGRVFVDLWELAQFSRCADCYDARRERIREMNLRQELRDRVSCSRCGGD